MQGKENVASLSRSAIRNPDLVTVFAITCKNSKIRGFKVCCSQKVQKKRVSVSTKREQLTVVKPGRQCWGQPSLKDQIRVS